MTSVVVDRLEQIRDILRGKKENDVEVVPYETSIHTPNTDRSLATSSTQLGVEGTLTSVYLSLISGGPSRDTYVIINLLDKNNAVKQTLLRGYIESSSRPSAAGAIPIRKNDRIRIASYCSLSTAPTFKVKATILRNKFLASGWVKTDESSLAAKGNIRSIIGTNPPAVATGDSGGESTEAVPTNAKWRLISYRIRLTTSATVSNRYAAVEVRDASANIMCILPSVVAQAASTGRTHFWGSSYNNNQVAATGFTESFPSDLILRQGYTLHTNSLLKMGDDLAAPAMLVEEWIEE